MRCWGESCASYDNHTFVPAASTPSQTAWGILGLLAGGDTTSRSLHKGIEHLMETQGRDGGWEEALSTGTGFPCVFYLKYVSEFVPGPGHVGVSQSDGRTREREWS